MHERTSWGWLAWTIPADGTPPELPVQIGVLVPGATWTQRLTVRWLLRRPAHRIALASASRVSLRFSTTAVAAVALVAAWYALSCGIPVGLVLPAILLAPLLAEHVPGWLDARAGEYVRTVEGHAACHYLRRLAALHTSLVDAAGGSDRYELRRSAEIGHQLLWEVADLLQTEDTRLVSARLIDRERLMVQLAHQVAQLLEHARAWPPSGESDRADGGEGPLGPLPPGFEPATASASGPEPVTAPLKGSPPVTQTPCDDLVRTRDVYVLFAHEPYYPSDGTQQVNATVVAGDALLHPQVRQPDGARIHDRLTRGRRPDEVVPLATLTHELGGGADWLYVGDWEMVITDLVQLVGTAECDALSLGLPEIARALICTGPNPPRAHRRDCSRSQSHLRSEGTRRGPGGDRHLPRVLRRRAGPVAGRRSAAFTWWID
ncbi:hypothetical protein ACFYVK_39975 [Streptomyces chartreusis]|uniref:hypothetical protein n=1 Tax=Streptomyces chartreusis TaxID=1969 RepID=UPI0036C89AC7